MTSTTPISSTFELEGQLLLLFLVKAQDWRWSGGPGGFWTAYRHGKLLLVAGELLKLARGSAVVLAILLCMASWNYLGLKPGMSVLHCT